MSLRDEVCVPCREGSPTLEAEEIAALRGELPHWDVVDGHHLHKRLTFSDFASALAWLNRAGSLCEKQGHHGDLTVGWGYVEINIHTHKAGGLTRADAILAAKLDEIEYQGEPPERVDPRLSEKAKTSEQTYYLD